MKYNTKIQRYIKILELLFLKLLIFFIVIMSSILLMNGFFIEKNYAKVKTNIKAYKYFSSNTECLYLSDIEYLPWGSYVGKNEEIKYDQIKDGSKISLKIENNTFTFEKGIWAPASSQIMYDVGEYNYKYFTAIIGLNTTSNRGDGVKFTAATAGADFDFSDPKYEVVKLPGQEAFFVKVDITNAKYLVLSADKIANDILDYAVYADAKLTNSEENYVLNSVEEYNETIKTQYNSQDDITGELELNLLKRELVKKIGKNTINSFYNENEDNKAVIDWLISDQRALRYYILGGTPEGNYYNSLTELSRLYRNYKEDFENKEVTKYGTVLGDLYTRMAISLSLTHSKTVGLWMQLAPEENKSDSVRRYAIYKFMHKNGYMKVLDNFDVTKWFENYTIEEMRFVMNNSIDDESILWLNLYTQERVEKYNNLRYLTPHPYVAYVYPNYGRELYYAEENKDYFNDLFSVKKTDLNSGKEILDADGNSTGRLGLWDVTYTIPGGKDVPEYTLKVTRGTSENKLYKVWMNIVNKFGTGAVCGGISKTGSNIRGVHGIPSSVIGQPAHAAIIYYTQDDNGNGYWNLDNDVDGWAYSEKGERMLLGWGNASFSRGYSVSYLALSQEVINDNDKFEQSEKFVYLADMYKDNLNKKEEIYRKALDIQPLNIDAWYELINVYNEASNKTEKDYYNLAEEMAESLKYFPLPMTHLTNLIKPRLTSVEYSYKFSLLQTRILTEASVVPNNTADNYYVYQPSLTRYMANFLLRTLDNRIATFSFDGEDAGKIALSSRYDNNGVRWDYSLDGKQTWKEVSFTADEEHKWQLTKEELASITSENDIYVHIVGIDYDETNVYKIDISESDGLPTTLFASDLENKILGAVDVVEWKYNENDEWKVFGEEEPVLTGNKTIILRMGATGTHITSKENITYTFTENNVNANRKYIPVSHITLENVSTEATNQQGSATFALDANYNTRWHSAWNGSDTERYITVRFDQPYNISAVEFVPAGGGNGKIYDGTVWGSMDGENWFVLSQKKGITYTNAANEVEQAIANIKSFDVDVPQRVQYVKIVADRTNGNWFTARAFNFYEDTTVNIVASFSFDGAKAGEINLIDSEYKDEWKYSLDGGNTWKSATGNKHQLSKNELKNITSENGIKIKFANDETEYSIKIKDAEVLELNPYVNDLENRLIGLTNVSNLEWKYSDEDEWTSYSEDEPIVKGNKTLQVRTKATGITIPSNVLEYQFTEDNQSDEMKYIPIKHLSIHSYSSQSVDSKRPFYAPNAIDGNLNTSWHTDFRYSIANTEAYISIKLDKPRYISGLDYLHINSTIEAYGFMKNGIVYVSEDGENWKEAGAFQDVAQDDTLKHIEFREPVYGQYVKLVIESHDNVFAVASMINLYEDVSQSESAVSIKYDITNKTNQSVTAEVVSDNIKITNNNGSKTFVFNENGSFTFEYEDVAGEIKSITAMVNWIDKTAPVGTISYSTRDVTNEDVVVTLTPSEEVTITNNNGSDKYTFTENGEFTFEFVDAAGNKGTATANVTWINRNAPVGTITYNLSSPTNKNVIATLAVDKGVVVTNNGGSKSYEFADNGLFTFEFVDTAGNRGTVTANVTWIDRVAPKGTIIYSDDPWTNGNVTATLITNEEVTVLNNNGSDKYTFTKNGTFTFEFTDKAGNKGTAIAKVDWIDKTLPKATITYSTTDPTNQDVIATITFDKLGTTITNNKGSNEYIFTKNGKFEFEFTGPAGNSGTAIAEVTNIDKDVPVATISYDIEALTNKNVTATITFNEENVTVKNGNTHVFEDIGEYTFEFVDSAGNTGTKLAKVTWIDKVVPTAKVTYDITTETEENVVATLESASEEITITNNGGKNTYTFTKNGVFTFEFVDKVGNRGTAKAEVTWIKTAEDKYQEAKVKAIEKIESYQSKVSNDEIENKKINAKEKSEVISAYDSLRDEDKANYTEFINRLKAGGKPIITKTSTEVIKHKVGETINLYSLITIKDNEDGNIVSNENNVKITTDLNIQKAGIYDITYEVIDSDGNTANLTIQVVIENENPDESNITSSEYEIEGNIIRNLPLDLGVNEFMKHIQAKKEVIIKDRNQNIIDGTSKIGTGMKAYVGEDVYTFIVKADIDGNGTVNLTDLAKMCLHYIEEESLVDEYLEAADIDNNNKITITDLAKMQLLLIQK